MAFPTPTDVIWFCSTGNISGSTLTNTGTATQNGTIAGSPTQTTIGTNSQNALVFTGTQTVDGTNDQSAMADNSAMSIACRFRFDTATASTQYIQWAGSIAINGRGFGIGIDSSNRIFATYGSGSSFNNTSLTTISTATVYTVVATVPAWVSGNITSRIYLNGSQVGTLTTNPGLVRYGLSNRFCHIGQGITGSAKAKVTISDARWWFSRVLSSTEASDYDIAISASASAGVRSSATEDKPSGQRFVQSRSGVWVPSSPGRRSK